MVEVTSIMRVIQVFSKKKSVVVFLPHGFSPFELTLTAEEAEQMASELTLHASRVRGLR